MFVYVYVCVLELFICLFVKNGTITSSEEYVGFSSVCKYGVISSSAKQQKPEEKNSPNHILCLVSFNLL